MMEVRHEAVFSLGANCGDRRKAVEDACHWLAGLLSDFECSSIYETPPVGHIGSDYLNGVAQGSWKGSFEALERLCKEYERNHGRDEESRRRKIVPIDIDIVLFDGVVLRPRDFSCSFFRIGFSQLMQ